MEHSIHTTNKRIKQAFVDKLLCGEELSMDDRESIAYELGATDTLGVALEVLCGKLWLQVKPSLFKLTKDERTLLKKLYPRPKAGRKPTGAGEVPMMMAIFHNSTDEKKELTQADIKNLSLLKKNLKGGYLASEAIRKNVEEGRKALSDFEPDSPKHLSISIRNLYEKNVITAVLMEV